MAKSPAKSLGRRPRSQANISQAREKIVAHALKLFREEGYAAISIRRLAKEVGCAPMTIYAHFDSKIDILQHLWAIVLDAVFSEIRTNIAAIEDPHQRLTTASQTFVKYWLDQPDHFRLVFMSNDITRPDVTSFIQNDSTLAHFRFFMELMQASLPQTRQDSAQVKARTDMLIASLIGIVFCANTIRDYPWTQAEEMVNMAVNIGIQA